MDSLKEFWGKFKGAIIGAIIAILIWGTGFYHFILGVILVTLGIIAGNYVQNNKHEVKDKIKNFIDKL
ncbi:MAG: DUF2273 domain-containing protein [Clostridia bacterium]|nr:DUF2273 domain-containing protein [Clostridia bacterium]